ncbi:MAG: hypothetical protein F4025_03250 [Synechococcus sp. SB0669_bin_7]|nr:hypothetical protein [Synechococcus sp. SB0675_bin_7]MYK85434.1 hypothetical protein [Synechococcus sp. SB0669_bin_7]
MWLWKLLAPELAQVKTNPPGKEPRRVVVRDHFEEVLIQGAFTASPELGYQFTRPGEEKKSPFVTIYFLEMS